MNDRPDILYLFRGAGHGGDAVATVRLAAAMRDSGVRVRCAASPFEDHFNAFTTCANSLGLPCDSLGYYNAAGGSRFRFATALAHYVRKLRPRVIHLQTGNGFVNPTLAMTLAVAHRGRRVVTLHGMRSRELIAAKHIRDQSISERFFHAIITPSQYARDSYLRCATRQRPARVHTVGNLAGPLAFRSRCEMRKELSIPRGVPLVLFTARLVETKGALLAVRAFICAAASHQNAVLLMAGDGPELDACREAARPLANRIRFLGFRDDIGNLMNASDIYVAASAFESFGLTTLEAMAAGATIVAVDIPATRELLGGTGRLVASSDMLAAELDWALSNPAECHRLGQCAKERYETRCSADAIVRQHLEIYGMAR